VQIPSLVMVRPPVLERLLNVVVGIECCGLNFGVDGYILVNITDCN